MTETLIVVVWRSYADWKVSLPFPTRRAAEKHVERYISDKYYNKCIQVKEIEVECD